jgi:hypothetical protein
MMEPPDSVNLDRFLGSFKQAGEFCIQPAILEAESNPPRLLSELAIRKFKW